MLCRGRRRPRRQLGRARLHRRLARRLRRGRRRGAVRSARRSSSEAGSCSRPSSPPSTARDGRRRPRRSSRPSARAASIPPFTRTSGPDSNSCFGCHNDPIEGGAGDDVANAFVSEGFESAQFDNVDPSFSSERHTIALTGAGLVELLAREMTADLQAIRADAVSAGVRSRARRSGRSRQQGRAFRLDRRPSRRHRRPRLGRRRRRRPHRAPVQPQGRVHLAQAVHHQRAQRPSRHGGGRALRRPLDGDARLRRERRAGRGHRRRRVVASLGLAKLFSRFPSQTSGGERQRAAIARALANNPLGDPRRRADRQPGPGERRQGLRRLQALARDRRTAIVLVTHDEARPRPPTASCAWTTASCAEPLRPAPIRAASAAAAAFALGTTAWHVARNAAPPAWDNAWYLEISFRLWYALKSSRSPRRRVPARLRMSRRR